MKVIKLVRTENLKNKILSIIPEKWVNKNLSKWKPRSDNYRYEEDVIFVRRYITGDITNIGKVEIPKYMDEITKISEKIGTLKIEEYPIGIAFGLAILYDINDWLKVNLKKDDKNKSEIAFNFFYLLKYSMVYLKVNEADKSDDIVKRIFNTLQSMVKKYDHKKKSYYNIINEKKVGYPNYEVLIDSGSPENFMSLGLAMFLNAEIVKNTISVSGFTSLQTKAVNTYPAIKVETVVINKDTKTGKIIEYHSDQRFGVIPNFHEFVGYHILVGFNLIQSLNNHGIPTILGD